MNKVIWAMKLVGERSMHIISRKNMNKFKIHLEFKILESKYIIPQTKIKKLMKN